MNGKKSPQAIYKDPFRKGINILVSSSEILAKDSSVFFIS